MFGLKHFIGFLIFGCLFVLLLMLPREYTHYYRVQKWTLTDGIVQGSFNSAARYSGYACVIDLQYNVGHNIYNAKVSRAGDCVVRKEDVLPIYVNPDDPSDYEDGYEGLLVKILGEK